MQLYDANADNSERWTRYLVEHYSDCNSVFVPVKRLSWNRDRELVETTLNRLAANSDEMAKLVGEYRAEKEAKIAKDASIAVGAVAPSIEMVTEKDKKVQLCHTLNGSALALPRIVAAILEDNQTADGIRIPKALQPYTGFEMID